MSVLGTASDTLKRSTLLQELIQLLMKKELDTAPNSGDPILGVRTFRKRIADNWGVNTTAGRMTVFGGAVDNTGIAYGLDPLSYDEGVAFFMETGDLTDQDAIDDPGRTIVLASGIAAIQDRFQSGRGSLLNSGDFLRIRVAPGHTNLKVNSKNAAPYELISAHVRLIPDWYVRGDVHVVADGDLNTIIPLATDVTVAFRADHRDEDDTPPDDAGTPEIDEPYGVGNLAYPAWGPNAFLDNGLLVPEYDVQPDFDSDVFFEAYTASHDIDLDAYRTATPVREVYQITMMIHPVETDDDWRNMVSESDPPNEPNSKMRAVVTSLDYTSSKYQGISDGSETIELTHVWPWVVGWSAAVYGHYPLHEQGNIADNDPHVSGFIEDDNSDEWAREGSIGSSAEAKHWDELSADIRNGISAQPFIASEKVRYVHEASGLPDRDQTVSIGPGPSDDPTRNWGGLPFFLEEIPWPGDDRPAAVLNNAALLLARYDNIVGATPVPCLPWGCTLHPMEGGPMGRVPMQGDQFKIEVDAAGTLPDSFTEGPGNHGFKRITPKRLKNADDRHGFAGYITSREHEHNIFQGEAAESGLRDEMENILTITFALAKVVDPGSNSLLSGGQEVMVVSSILSPGPTQRFRAGFIADPDAEGVFQAIDLYLIPGVGRSFYEQKDGQTLIR